MLSREAIKAGLAGAVEAQAAEDLVGGDSRFDAVWNVTAAVPGSFSRLNAAAMFAILRELRPANIVEIGSYLGRSTVFLARAQRELGVRVPSVTAIDPHTGDRQQMDRLGVSTLPSFDLFEAHVDACGVSDVVTPVVKPSAKATGDFDGEAGFLYIDGWHSYDAVIRDGRDWLPRLTADGVVFFDDYTRYTEVYEAVHDLAQTGAFNLWGNSFGQAVGGSGAPPAAATHVLRVARRPMARRLHRLRQPA